jgi:alkylated DNA repair dioxygenase AlkB
MITDAECNEIKQINIAQNIDEAISPYLLYHPAIHVYGKVAHQQRSIGFFTDDRRVKGYKYSGQIISKQKLTPIMNNIMVRINRDIGASFNAILLNYYADGTEYISAHSDSQTGLENGIVASISVGVNRTFRIRNKITTDIVYETPTFEKGLIIMTGRFQDEFTHEIPIEKNITLPRWSLTFRTHNY